MEERIVGKKIVGECQFCGGPVVATIIKEYDDIPDPVRLAAVTPLIPGLPLQRQPSKVEVRLECKKCGREAEPKG